MCTTWQDRVFLRYRTAFDGAIRSIQQLTLLKVMVSDDSNRSSQLGRQALRGSRMARVTGSANMYRVRAIIAGN
jgi:hypothetical protein